MQFRVNELNCSLESADIKWIESMHCTLSEQNMIEIYSTASQKGRAEFDKRMREFIAAICIRCTAIQFMWLWRHA